jgi:hypothetical protein
MSRHYGLKVGDIILLHFYPKNGKYKVVELDLLDNNKCKIQSLTTLKTISVTCEECNKQ